MKKSVLKKLTAFALIVVCVAGMAFGVNATSVTVTFSGCPSGSDRGPYGYSTYKVHPSSQWLYPYVSSVGFVGLPSEVWPTNKCVYSALFTGDSMQSNLVSFTAKNQTRIAYIADTTKTYRVGAATTSSQGATIQEQW